MRRWFMGRTDCDRASKLLSACLDGYLEPKDRAWLEAHLAGCARCQEEMASLNATVTLLRGLPRAEPRRSFLVAPRPAPVPVPVWGWRALRLATAVATVLLVSVLTVDALGLVTPRPTAQPAPPPTVTIAAPQGLAGPAGPAAPPVAGTALEASTAYQEAQPTPAKMRAVADMAAKAPVTPSPVPYPTPLPGTPEPVPTPTPYAAPLPTPSPTPARTLAIQAWQLQAGLVGVWLALVLATAYRWRTRRKGVRPGQ